MICEYKAIIQLILQVKQMLKNDLGNKLIHYIVESILQEKYPDIPKFRNVHQLDYATSGVYVLALTKSAAALAARQFQQRLVKKTYLALVNGHMPNDV